MLVHNPLVPQPHQWYVTPALNAGLKQWGIDNYSFLGLSRSSQGGQQPNQRQGRRRNLPSTKDKPSNIKITGQV
jgi:hypothetical protein